MTKVLVFTNRPSLNSVDEIFLQRTDVKLLNSDNKILRFAEDASTFEISNDFSREGLYFVLDTIPFEEFQPLLGGAGDTKFYILRHREPDESIFNLDKFAPNVLQGEHESNGSYYPDLVKILSDDKGEKMDRIVKEIFDFDPVCEANLNLLISLFPEKVPNDLDGLLEQQLPTEEIRDLTGKSYNDKLTMLRIALLGY